MKIEVKKLFLHERDRFEAGEVRVVDDELGAYFLQQGWAVEVGKPAPEVQAPAETSLDVQNGTLGVGDSNG